LWGSERHCPPLSCAGYVLDDVYCSAMEPCSLCLPSADRVLLESEAAIALSGPSSTNDARVVVVPRRHVARMCELTEQEHDDLLQVVEEIRQGLGGPASIAETVEYEEGKSNALRHAHVTVTPAREGDSSWAALGGRIRNLLKRAREEYSEFGGWAAMRTGEWVWGLVGKCFRNYWERANVEYFYRKYGTRNKRKIREVLIAVAAKNAAVLGAVTGAALTADEITALATLGEGGVGLPANVAIFATALSTEAILLLRFELQLVANLGKLYGVPLKPDDPEDILTILAFAAGGSAAEAAGRLGMRVGAKAAERAVKGVFRKDLLAALKRIAAKIGVKVLQRSIVKYTVPAASIGIGAAWNYASVRAVGRVACKHFEARGGKLE